MVVYPDRREVAPAAAAVAVVVAVVVVVVAVVAAAAVEGSLHDPSVVLTSVARDALSHCSGS